MSANVYGQYSTTPQLTDAKQLLLSKPQQSLTLVNHYLSQRTLLNDAGFTSLNITEQKRTRTPLNSILAMQLKADALIELMQYEEALQTLIAAKALAEEHRLRYLTIDTQIKIACVQWLYFEREEIALNLLDELNQKVHQSTPPFPLTLISKLTHNIDLHRAEIYAKQNKIELAQTAFESAQNKLAHLPNSAQKIKFLLKKGKFHQQQHNFELALDAFHQGYVMAEELRLFDMMAQSNLALAQLLRHQQVLDKALEHVTQAVEFYENANQHKLFARSLGLMAQIYEDKGSLNMALIHYFNALDMEQQFKQHLPPSEELRMNIARVYIQLNNSKKAQQYLSQAKSLAKKQNNDPILTEIRLLEAKLMLNEGKSDNAIVLLQNILIAASRFNLLETQIEAERMLSLAFEKNQDHYSALISQRRYEHLWQTKQQKQQAEHAALFRQQQVIHQRTAHLQKLQSGQEAQNQALYVQRWINGALLFFSACSVGMIYRRHRKNHLLQQQIRELKQQLYSHPNSGLKNLRMLKMRLPNSLKQSSEQFEQNLLHDLIPDPLRDRLRFALIEIPQIKHWYRDLGYQRAIELEQNFGDYLTKQICNPARLYHLSTTIFLYIEPNARLHNEPRDLAHSLQKLVDQFMTQQQMARILPTRIGLAEYPFLPRAYTAINAKELLDILFIALSKAYDLSTNNTEHQWVHFSALENTPAAYFTQNTLHTCCQQAIEQGLIKVQSSSPLPRGRTNKSPSSVREMNECELH